MLKRLLRQNLGSTLEIICIAIALSVIMIMYTGGSEWFARVAGLPSRDDLLLSGVKANHAEWINAALARGASVNVRDANGMTPLMWAAEGGDEELVRRFIRAGADVSLRCDRGTTALSWAAAGGHDAIVKILLEAGADITQPAFVDGTPLHVAVAMGEPATVALLIQCGADVNARNRLGQTPAMIAASLDDGEAIVAIRELLAVAADKKSRDADLPQ